MKLLEELKNVDVMYEKALEVYADFRGKQLGEMGKIVFVDRFIRDVVTNVKNMFGVDLLSRFTFYGDEENNFMYAKIILSTIKKDKVQLKHDFTVSFKEDVKHIIDNIYMFVKEYNSTKENLFKIEQLNHEFDSICNDYGISYKVSFALGKGILDISDNHVVFGVTEEVLDTIFKTNLFHKNDILKAKYREVISDTLKMVEFPYELVKVKNRVTKDFGIASNKKVTSLIKEVFNKNVDKFRVGKGYVETDDTFAVVVKEAIREDEAIAYDYVVENDNPSKKELEFGQTKIGVNYIIKPFCKKTLVKK